VANVVPNYDPGAVPSGRETAIVLHLAVGPFSIAGRKHMLGIRLNARSFLEKIGAELLRIDPAEVKALSDVMHACYLEDATIFLIGNGGSGSNASHFCEDVGKSSLRREDFDDDTKKRIRIISLTDNTPYILAWGNDEGYDRIFVEQLKNLARPGDLLIAISGSGNSPNILRAVEWAKKHSVKTFGCTGFNGGKLRTLAHQNLHVPLDDMGIVETIHLAAFHWVVDDLHRRLADMPVQS
jgi:D-sedoheptulose 7-phosphate isomerase